VGEGQRAPNRTGAQPHAITPPFFASARGRLLIFNLLVVAVTLMVSGVAVLGFRHASQSRSRSSSKRWTT
jgi:hypothetical protein